MTQQIGRAYRRNRRRSWLLIAAVVAIAAAAIPIASGAAEKTYTLGFDTQTLSAQTKSVCTGDTTVVDVYLTNTAKSASLGAARITAPTYGKVTSASKNGTALPASDVTGLGTNVVTVQNMGLAKNAYVKLTVEVTPTNAGPSTVSAIVKQSNEFNDSSGAANLFSNPATWPTLQAVDCVGTISGKVWNDQNESKVKDVPFEAAQFGTDTSPDSPAWTITLYKKGTGGGYTAMPLSQTLTLTGSTGGAYTFSGVPLNNSYIVCVTKPSNASTWIQSIPTTAVATCSTGEPNGWGGDVGTNASGLAPFTQNQVGKDFGNALSTTVLTCGGAANTNPDFSVEGGTSASGNCKTGTDVLPSAEYVYEKWTENGIQYASFHPVTGDGVCPLTSTTAGTCTYFVQKLSWEFDTNAQPDPANRALRYDDKKNASGLYEFEAMKYCKKDPRATGSELALAPLGTPANVATTYLPDGGRADGDAQSSCLITSTESTTDTAGKIRRVDYVLTAVDGRSNIG